MLNLHELESRWLRYKVKSYIPQGVILLSFIVIGIVLVSTDFNTAKIEKKADITPKKLVKKVIQKQTIEKSISLEVAPQKAIKKHTQKIIIQPSLNFMSNIKTNSPAYYNDHRPIKKATHKKTVLKKEPIKKKILVLEEPQVEVVNETVINIKRQNTQDDVSHVIKRFKKSNNPALSLFIAKKYYALENYSEAYNYALITNSINNSIEESWIVFAKSLVKLGKKDKAMEMLKKYISSSHSQRAKLLLDKIKSGKFQ